jgi:hypothetical protein
VPVARLAAAQAELKKKWNNFLLNLTN